MYYGNGGFIYSEVYIMPIHIRRYHIKKINDLHVKHNEDEQKAINTSKQNMQKMTDVTRMTSNLITINIYQKIKIHYR